MFLKFELPGFGAAVRNDLDARCPPSTSGCEVPEIIVKAADADGLHPPLDPPNECCPFVAVEIEAPIAPQVALLSLTFFVIAAGLDCGWALLAGRVRGVLAMRGRLPGRISHPGLSAAEA